MCVCGASWKWKSWQKEKKKRRKNGCFDVLFGKWKYVMNVRRTINTKVECVLMLWLWWSCAVGHSNSIPYTRGQSHMIGLDNLAFLISFLTKIVCSWEGKIERAPHIPLFPLWKCSFFLLLLTCFGDLPRGRISLEEWVCKEKKRKWLILCHL